MLDTFGASVDGSSPSMGVVAVDDGVGGTTFTGSVVAWRDVSGAPHLNVLVSSYDGSGVYCPLELVNPVPWAEVGFEVIWSDGGATVDVSTGALTNHCTGSFKVPENVRLRLGIIGITGGKSPPSWQLRLDNFIVDVE